MKDITVLITGIGAPGAHGIVKSLKVNGERNIKIVGVDINANANKINKVDAFYEVPLPSDEHFIEKIKEVCILESVDVILPLVTKELMSFSTNKEALELMGVKVSVMKKETLEIVNDKGKLLTVIQENNLPTPEFYLAKNVEETKDYIKRIGYPDNPFVIKATNSNGSRGVRTVNPKVSKYDLFFNEKPNSMYTDYDNLMNVLKEKPSIPELMIMEYLPGKEYSVDVLANNGKVLKIGCRYNSIVKSSIGLECTIEQNTNIEQQVAKITEMLSLDGNFGFDFKENNLGEPRIMEVNPRLTAGIVAFTAAGFNFPYMGVKKVLGENIEIKNVLQYGTTMLRRWEELYFDARGNELLLN